MVPHSTSSVPGQGGPRPTRPAATPTKSKSKSKSKTHFTLRKKLTLSLMTVGLASLCVASLVYMSCDMFSVRSSMLERCALVAERLAITWQMNATSPVEDGSLYNGSLYNGLSTGKSIHSVRILDAHGLELGRFAPHALGGDSPVGDGPSFDGWFDGFLHPLVQREAVLASGPLGGIEVRASAAPLYARLRVHASLFLVLAGVSTLITLALGRRVHHRFSDQLLDLAHAANAISKRKDYSIRAVRRSDDEIGILVDTFNHMITQIELRDEQLRSEVKRAEAARVAKSQFLATMSHEIRTPINGVLGMTQLLLDTPLSSEQVEFTRTIHGSAEGLLSVINDILDFSRGEAGRYEIEHIRFAPTTVVHECLDTVSIVAAEKKLELCLEIDERVPSALIGDPSRLRQVLLNLLSNALKFTATGEIFLRVQVEEESLEHARVRFEVQDTGIGIPKDRIDRLFESFSQVDASRTRKYGGTGLGLAISKQIVEAMGGTMFVKTEEGVGSTFGFKLKLRVEAGAGEDNVLVAPRSLRVLIADPSATSAGTLSKMLQQGNSVQLAGDGATARMLLLEAAAAQRPFDLILTDLRLTSSFESLDMLGEGELGNAPLIVLAPVNQLSGAKVKGWPSQTASLVKPIKRSELFWCVAEILRGPMPVRKVTRPKALEPALPEGLRVLVAEDHPVNQRITTRFLEKIGVAWEVAVNGEEALQAFKEREFDLVLMDVQMPVMDGLEATLAIRKLEALRGTHVPIVALTANVLQEHRKETHEAGFDDFLAKPVKLEELRSKIRKWVQEETSSESVDEAPLIEA